MAINFSNFDSIVSAINKLLKIKPTGGNTTIPSPLIIVGGEKRSGLSAIKIANAIIQRKSEAGLPVGALPSGAVSPDEIMERIRIEEIIKAFQEDAKITIAITPGTSLTANGTSPSGPVTVFGSTITIATGYGVIQ
jgi:hypothetical protein